MNKNNLFLNINKSKFIIHFIGIGGNGMFSIAEYMLLSGYNITGSDIYFNNKIYYLLGLGVKIYNNHSSKNVLDVNLVVYSSAINILNCEIVSAKICGIPVISRIEMLYELIKYNNLITIIGSHGKTTTCSLIFDLLFYNNIKVNCINGGNIKSINSYIYLSDSNLFLLELDESDGNFLLVKPTIVVLTNIDNDHLNNYNNNIDNLISYFICYLRSVPFYGYIIACIDNFYIRKILDNNFFNTNIITYGFSNDSNFRINNLKNKNNKNYFSLFYKNHKYNFITNMFGKHNILNIVSSICLFSIFSKIDYLNIQKFLYLFKGVCKRSEVIGEYSFSYKKKNYNNILFILDYGHHPTEIKYTLNGIHKFWLNRRIISIFQPHRFSRTKLLINEFSKVLIKLDILLLLNIYSANENNNYTINSNILLNNMYDIYHYKNCIFIDNIKFINIYLLKIIRNNDILLFQGAGETDIFLLNFLNKYIK